MLKVQVRWIVIYIIIHLIMIILHVYIIVMRSIMSHCSITRNIHLIPFPDISVVEWNRLFWSF